MMCQKLLLTINKNILKKEHKSCYLFIVIACNISSIWSNIMFGRHCGRSKRNSIIGSAGIVSLIGNVTVQ